MKSRGKQVRATVSRWLDLLLYGVVAFCLLAVAEPLARDFLQPLVDEISGLPIWLLVALVGVAVGCAVQPIWNGCPARIRSLWSRNTRARFLAYLLLYPPLWIGIVLTLATWHIWLSFKGFRDEMGGDLRPLIWVTLELLDEVPNWTWLCVMIALLVSLLRYAWSDSRPAPASPRPSSHPRPMPLQERYRFHELRDWVLSDREVYDAGDDLFGHSEIAVRIARRLQGQGAEPCAMAVIGPKGSGKTSISRMVEGYINGNSKLRIVRVSLWPYGEIDPAVRGILSAMVSALSTHVSTLAISGLSSAYVSTIRAASDRLAGLFQIADDRAPREVLETFSRIASTIGVHFVLWVEDLERFRGHMRDDAIFALLCLLEQLDNVSIIYSDVEVKPGLDSEKVVRFIELVPLVRTKDAWRVLDILRRGCFVWSPTPIIDPASLKRRSDFAPPESDLSHRAMREYLGKSAYSPFDILVDLLRTPRQLKSALRITLETWFELPGELDFDSALIASTIRVTQPELFSLIAKHIDELRKGVGVDETGDASERNREVGKKRGLPTEITDALSKESDETRTALYRLLRELFPLPSKHGLDDRQLSQPQGFFLSGPVDYWRRYLSQSMDEGEGSDQELLGTIQRWKKVDAAGNAMADQLLDDRQARRVEQFTSQFSPEELCRLLNELCATLSTMSAANWDREAHPPGIVPVWRMMHLNRPARQMLQSTVRDIVQKHLPTHLPLVHEVVYYFCENSPNVPSLLPQNGGVEIRKLVETMLVSAFAGPGASERLRIAMREGSPWVVSWLVWGQERLNGDRTGIPWKAWPAFAETLMSLAESHPEVGVPLIVPFVTRSEMTRGTEIDEDGLERPSRGLQAEFQEDLLSKLFDPSRVRKLLANFVPPDTLDEQIRHHCEVASEACRTRSDH